MDVPQIIAQALKCELSGNILEAQKLYETSVSALRTVAKQQTTSERQNEYVKHIHSYELHERSLRQRVLHHMLQSRLIEQHTIPEDAQGYSYRKLFGHHLNDLVTEAQVHECNLASNEHYKNLINLLQVFVSRCPNLKYLRVLTQAEGKVRSNAEKVLKQVKVKMLKKNVDFNYQFDNTMRDNKIVLGTGIIIKIEHGLHYFQPEVVSAVKPTSYTERKCKRTDVYVWRSVPFSWRLENKQAGNSNEPLEQQSA